LPQTAEALATVDNSVRSVVTRAECAITFANFFISILRFFVEASVEDVDPCTLEDKVECCVV
jgi:hypothetical protein